LEDKNPASTSNKEKIHKKYEIYKILTFIFEMKRADKDFRGSVRKDQPIKAHLSIRWNFQILASSRLDGILQSFKHLTISLSLFSK